jgi:N-dimethylarginine dimethylaminohydrolase
MAHDDPTTWSTHKGPGWVARARDHRSDLGTHWGSCGVDGEWKKLARVLLSEPGPEVAVADPSAELMLASPDASRMRQQCDALAAAYREHDVQVEVLRSPWPSTANQIFVRDQLWMTPEGAVIGRMAAEQRAGEERFASWALSSLGIPIVGTVRGRATFEGADALWLRPDVVLVGIGQRTNASGFDTVAAIARSFGAAVFAMALPARVQHLLGAINVADRDLATVRPAATTAKARDLLRELGFTVLELPESTEIVTGYGMNYVALGGRRVLMPRGADQTKSLLEENGVRCFEVDVGEYLKAAGGVGCATGILERTP